MTTLTLAILLASLLSAGADDKKAEAKPAPAAAQSKTAAIPADAKQIEPGLYRWRDPQGKTWILRKSPFGVLKSEEKNTAQAADEVPQGMKVIEEGDELRFERPTPFGLMRWQRKKTELNEMEQRAWEREQKRRAESRPKE